MPMLRSLAALAALALTGAALAFGAAPAVAQTAGQTAAPAAPAATPKDGAVAGIDPELEKKLWDIAIELRCLVCQNQTIADSNADLAVDLRNQVRTMLQQGKSQREIIDYMTARYGDFVLYRPPVKTTTWLLWFGPGVLMVAAVASLWLVLRRRSRLPAHHFDPDEAEEADAADRSDGLRGPAASPR